MAAELEVADVFRRHGEAYRLAHAGHIGRVERRVMSAIELCRTAALGGHIEQCEDCGIVRIAYNSCRNRHCPKCQGAAREDWLAARAAELLPVPYFHVVFTLPAPAAEIAFHNKEVIYTILFKAAAEALRTIAADPTHLGSDASPSPAHSLRRARWRSIARRRALGRLPAGVLPAGPGSVQAVSSAVPAEPANRLRSRPA